VLAGVFSSALETKSSSKGPVDERATHPQRFAL
jgi:hypothetical protein